MSNVVCIPLYRPEAAIYDEKSMMDITEPGLEALS